MTVKRKALTEEEVKDSTRVLETLLLSNISIDGCYKLMTTLLKARRYRSTDEKQRLKKLIRTLESLSIVDCGLPLISLVNHINTLKGYGFVRISLVHSEKLSKKTTPTKRVGSKKHVVK